MSKNGQARRNRKILRKVQSPKSEPEINGKYEHTNHRY